MITAYEAQLDALYASMLTGSTKDIEEYSFNSGDGSQRAIHRDLSDIQKAIDIIERKIEHWYSRLRGRGIVRMSNGRR
jgi:hypothetical protein